MSRVPAALAAVVGGGCCTTAADISAACLLLWPAVRLTHEFSLERLKRQHWLLPAFLPERLCNRCCEGTGATKADVRAAAPATQAALRALFRAELLLLFSLRVVILQIAEQVSPCGQRTIPDEQVRTWEQNASLYVILLFSLCVCNLQKYLAYILTEKKKQGFTSGSWCIAGYLSSQYCFGPDISISIVKKNDFPSNGVAQKLNFQK